MLKVSILLRHIAVTITNGGHIIAIVCLPAMVERQRFGHLAAAAGSDAIDNYSHYGEFVNNKNVIIHHSQHILSFVTFCFLLQLLRHFSSFSKLTRI